MYLHEAHALSGLVIILQAREKNLIALPFARNALPATPARLRGHF